MRSLYKPLISERKVEALSKFSFQLRIMENGNDLKVVDLYSDSFNYYTGKGISIAMILKAKELFNRRIISSSSEANWKDAVEKVWKRMQIAGLVAYDSVKDYYYTV